jgi:hypothetical protein
MEEIWRLHYIRFGIRYRYHAYIHLGPWRLHPYFFGLRALTPTTIGFDAHLAEFQVLRFDMLALLYLETRQIHIRADRHLMNKQRDRSS